jgi:hypothetical protein
MNPGPDANNEFRCRQYVRLSTNIYSLKNWLVDRPIRPSARPPLPTTVCLHLRNSHGSRTGGEVTLNSNDLVVVRSELEAHLRPGIKVRLCGDSAAAALRVTNGPVLLKGLVSLDARGVGASRRRNLVRAAVRGDASLGLGSRRGVVGAEILDDWSC